MLEFISTKQGDPERGPMVRLRSSEARIRLVEDGELVWVHGPRRKEVAVLVIDEAIPAGKVALADIAGVTVDGARRNREARSRHSSPGDKSADGSFQEAATARPVDNRRPRRIRDTHSRARLWRRRWFSR